MGRPLIRWVRIRCVPFPALSEVSGVVLMQIVREGMISGEGETASPTGVATPEQRITSVFCSSHRSFSVYLQFNP